VATPCCEKLNGGNGSPRRHEDTKPCTSSPRLRVSAANRDFVKLRTLFHPDDRKEIRAARADSPGRAP
jgi:hypothetical protein